LELWGGPAAEAAMQERRDILAGNALESPGGPRVNPEGLARIQRWDGKAGRARPNYL
jgi:hypothetical protein